MPRDARCARALPSPVHLVAPYVETSATKPLSGPRSRPGLRQLSTTSIHANLLPLYDDGAFSSTLGDDGRT
ncbi:hypothetical protein GQ602_002853 [Ophiocordyceps camponoti-floridani]|uniref:Uncharacterized protein n=1 Tax=Ophiocordyceps camponoti-floridani TaxID=2030778 RepID=A0A8H4QB56_9HYPO|nr:hypothetical protein GQ602_002853 [Ophiocordyceps camponoti-floridani]